MYIERGITNILKTASKSFLLLGPRQTGKSTLIKGLNPDLEINLADEEVFVQYLTDPGMLRRVIGKKKRVFIDEVQRLTSLLNTIQTIIDSNNNIKFLLTGSSARKLRRGKANLLPGRLMSYELGPLSYTELNKQFNLQKAFSRGLLPGIYFNEDADWEKQLRTYAITYLKEEIQAESLTRNLEGFSRFFEVVLSQNGNFIDFTKFASLAAIERMSAKRYFDILVDTLILYPIESFSKSKIRRLIQHPRFYFFDIGVYNGVLGNFTASLDRIGILFENLFLQIMLSELKSRDQDHRVTVYRTEKGAEVDFILERKSEVYAIEVKATKKINSGDLNGLRSFNDFYKKKHRSIVVYLGELSQSFDGIEVLSLESAINELFE